MTNYLPIPKGIFIIISFFFFGVGASAQAVANFEWVNTVGNLGNDYIWGVSHDQSGNIYTTGRFLGVADFDPGPGIVNLTSAGGSTIYSDIFISKTAPNGNLIWAKSIGSNGQDGGANVVVDGYGHIYVAGWFTDTVDFDPGSNVSTLISAPNRNLFLMKMDTAGNYIWAKRIGTPGYNHQQSLMIDPSSGSLVMSGTFSGVATFGTLSITSAGGNDQFIAKADTAGNFSWAQAIGGATVEIQLGTVSGIDDAGSIYVGGYFRTTVDFDPGPGIFNLTSISSTYDGYIVKYSASGQFVWVKQFASSTHDQLKDIIVDKNGYLYCTGMFGATFDANPNTAIFDLNTNGSNDIFIIKMDTSGAFIWAKSIGSTGSDAVSGLAIDSAQQVYIAGQYVNSIDVNPGAGIDTLTGSAGFLLKLDSAGNFVWGINLPTGGANLTVDNDDNVYVGSYFMGTKDFDPSPGTANKTSAGEADIYLLKLNQDCSSFDVYFETVCDSFSLNGQTYTASGNYSQVYSNSLGCDSTIYINLTVSHSFDSLITVSACGSYTFDGTVHTTSGTYVHTYTSSATGCDSLMTINLTIFNTIQGDTLTIATCDSFEYQGMKYGLSGMYTHAFVISTGCDSIVTLDLSINIIDTSISQSETTLTANALGATYQWLDCNNNNTPVTGAQSRIFDSNVDGSYAVVVTKGDCSDTSTCYTVTHGTGIGKLSNSNGFSLHPNPTDGLFTLDFSNKVNNASLSLFNAIGQQIESINAFSGTTTSFDLRAQASGIYYLKVAALENAAWIKIVKQ